MTRLIFCKIYDELHNYRDLKFKAGAEEADEEIAKRIESELNYPGEIKVNVVRESRVIEYAK